MFEIAHLLHMPMYKLENEMPYSELLKWITYFKKRPTGWQDDQRTYMLLAAQGVKGKPESFFPSIAAMKKQSEADNAQAAPKGLILSLMKNAKGGDDTNWNFNDLEK